MKRVFTISLMATLAVCSCQVQEIIDPTRELLPEAKTFTATIEDNTSGETKTTLDENGNVLWKQGDQISVFAGSTVNERYQVTDDSDGKKAAVLNKVSETVSESGKEIANNVAFYPYISSPSLSLYSSGYSYTIASLFFPAEQNYTANSFGNGAFPMVAVTSSTDDINFKFKNVLGGLKLQLKGTASITSISVTSNNGESLCGYADVVVPLSGTPTLYLSGYCMTVVLDCGAGVQLDAETPTSFIIALPPITMTGGFTVVVTDTEGKRMEIKTTKPQTINRSTLLRMPPVEYVGTADELDYSNEPFTITSHGSTAVALVSNYSPKAISLEYKKGDGAWTEYTIVDRNDFYYDNQVIGDPIELADGETLQFRAGEGGNDTFSQSSSYVSTMGAYYNVEVIGSGTVDASGNVMSLVDRSMKRTSLDSYMFHGLFFGCTKLVDASNLKLPATTLASSCYLEMFHACQGLVSAPDLPATTLANYCYYGMFDGCYNLITAPDLPATELASDCYNAMFYNCRSLTTAPKLPAIRLASECYKSMFEYCESLTTAPELPAANLKYQCYTGMFKRCSNLNYVKASFVTDPNSKLSRDLFDWLDGVSYTGTFVKNAAAKWDVRGSSGVPEGWTIEYDPADLGLPTVGDVVIDDVAYNTVTVRSSSSNDASEISQCGFYYGTSANAITTWARSFNFEDGVFSREITGLTPGTTYYIKSYVTNEAGTMESDVVSFTTLAKYGTINGHEWVDIGIRKSMFDSSIVPGSSEDRRVVFARQNIGASSQYGTGYFFRGNELYGWKYSGSTSSYTQITSTNLVRVDNEGNTIRPFQHDHFYWDDEDLDFSIEYTTGDAITYYYGSGWEFMPKKLIKKLYCHSQWYSTLPSTVSYTLTSLAGLSLTFAFTASRLTITNSNLGTSVVFPYTGSIGGPYWSCYYFSGSGGNYWGEGDIEEIYGGGIKYGWAICIDTMGDNYDPDLDDYTTWEYAWESSGEFDGMDVYVGHPIRAVAELPLQ